MKYNFHGVNKLVRFSISILICLLVGLVGSVFTMPAIPTWYASLNKPLFSPPNYLFGPVWTTLYILMGISFFLVWGKLKQNQKAKMGIDIFILQLILNCLWSAVFFGLKSPGLALLVIVILWLAILATIAKFKEVSRPASLLLVPYLLWVSFALILNFAIFRLN